MKSMSSLWLILILNISLAFAQTSGELENYIKQLGHEDYTIRERAEQKLIQAGKASIPYLKKALDSGDAEISWRAETLLEEIYSNINVNKPKKIELDEEQDNSDNPISGVEDPFKPKTSLKSFTSGSFSIYQNGSVFKVNTKNDGSFSIFVQEKGADGKLKKQQFNYQNEAEFQEQNPKLFKRYKKASEGITFERIIPRRHRVPSQQNPNSGFSFDFGFGSQNLKGEDIRDMVDIFGELFNGNGQVELDKILKKKSTQRMMNRFMDSLAEENPQLREMLEMQRKLLKQLDGQGGNLFGNGRDPFDMLGNRNRQPRQPRANKNTKTPKKAINSFSQTMEAYSFPGLELAPMAEELKKHILHRGAVVSKATKKAKEAGLERFDIILSINGVATPTPEDALKILGKLDKGQPVILKVLRKLKEITVAFNF